VTNAREDVRQFYERIPYPPPLTSLHEEKNLYGNPARRRALFHRMFPTERPRPHQEILIAGCGTSQAASHALREPDARVTAIDISATSLDHTRELQRKYNLQNLELHQLPLERVGELAQTFDQIVCTGVLHHLPDPDAGLRSLRDALEPHGAIHVMVYAPYGRAGIYMMQEYCRRVGISASPGDLRELSALLGGLSPDHPIAAVLRRAADFRTPNALADALLHPLDRAYTVPEIYGWLERCGLTFARWTEQAPYLPQCGWIAKSPHAGRLRSLPAARQHAAIELLRGNMTTHSFIAVRDDRPGAAQPIAFAGNRWRSYIPIDLPWTVCVRERLPAASVAVLINRSHTFTDLICTVDDFEDELLGAIDGQRTLGEILSAVGDDPHTERRALGFFERLWHYDQVVFDATAARSAEKKPVSN
jgi:SAM-dependent methyltransferase